MRAKESKLSLFLKQIQQQQCAPIGKLSSKPVKENRRILIEATIYVRSSLCSETFTLFFILKINFFSLIILFISTLFFLASMNFNDDDYKNKKKERKKYYADLKANELR